MAVDLNKIKAEAKKFDKAKQEIAGVMKELASINIDLQQEFRGSQSTAKEVVENLVASKKHIDETTEYLKSIANVTREVLGDAETILRRFHENLAAVEDLEENMKEARVKLDADKSNKDLQNKYAIAVKAHKAAKVNHDKSSEDAQKITLTIATFGSNMVETRQALKKHEVTIRTALKDLKGFELGAVKLGGKSQEWKDLLKTMEKRLKDVSK